MRRWVCILLLLFVPLHFSSAAAAAAAPCGDHDRNAQAQQPADDGRAHQHDAVVVSADQASGPAAGIHDGNSRDCLGHCAAALLSPAPMP